MEHISLSKPQITRSRKISLPSIIYMLAHLSYMLGQSGPTKKCLLDIFTKTWGQINVGETVKYPGAKHSSVLYNLKVMSSTFTIFKIWIEIMVIAIENMSSSGKDYQNQIASK